MKKAFIFLFIICLLIKIPAQDKKVNNLIYFGISQPILDNGNGFHLGFNPSLKLKKQFFLEGQLSYLYTNIDSYFLSGDNGRLNSVNILSGGRLYLNSSENKSHFFINLLFGLNYEIVSRSGREVTDQYGLGFTIGGFYRFNKYNFGLNYDTHNILLKCGYSF